MLSYFSQSFFFSVKICLVLFFFIWVRATFPRYLCVLVGKYFCHYL
jgi:NADH:ubiquinone oxidoreductase subunit H